jgi:hypothetical protein
MLPYNEIVQSAERRWTFSLLERLVASDLSVDERERIAAALQALSDRRSIPLLEQLLLDTFQSSGTRETASEILRGMQYLDHEWPEAVLRAWWNSNDTLLRRHALLSMDAGVCPDIVREVAADVDHPLRIAALMRMIFYFDSPTDLKCKLAALTDPSPRVRETAAWILLYDEPVMAESALILVTEDTVAEVATEAINTLEYYPSVRVIRCLHALHNHSNDRICESARSSFSDIRKECQYRLKDQGSRVANHVRRWLEPVWNLLAFTTEELTTPAELPNGSLTSSTKPLPDVSELLGLLASPDSSLKLIGETLWNTDWEQCSTSDRLLLRPVLLIHGDPLVRERAAVPFQAWNDVDALLALAGDSDFGVRKSAFYRLGLLPFDPRIAASAWNNLQKTDVLGVHATETLSTYVAHADKVEAIPRLFAIAHHRNRPEDLRAAAVHHLSELNAVDEISQLIALLDEPPAVTWSLHIAILHAAIADLGRETIDIQHLEKVDNLHIQAAIGLFMQ